jgi:hypothetical protein
MTFRSDPKPADFKPLFHARGRMNAAMRRVRAQSVGYLRPGFPRMLEDFSFLFPPAEVVDLASVRAEREGRPAPARYDAVAAELTRLLRSLKR